MSVESWKSISADGAPPGTYTPNMSREDAAKWNAKLCGHRSGHPQVEIRSSRGGSQLLVIVSLEANIKYQGRTSQCNVRMSANGPLHFSFDDWQNLNLAIEEAKEKLAELQG